jgi:hypothetical protein
MESGLSYCQPSPARLAIVSFSVGESRLKQRHRMRAADLPGSGRTVTNQVTTAPVNSRHSAMHTDNDFPLACGNST